MCVCVYVHMHMFVSMCGHILETEFLNTNFWVLMYNQLFDKDTFLSNTNLQTCNIHFIPTEYSP